MGGFVVDELRWKNGVVTYLRIRSTLGGNFRLSCRNQLTSKTHHLVKATGDNPNSFFATTNMPVTRVNGDSYESADQMESSLPSKFVWDVDTKKGEVVECVFNDY